MIIDKILGTYRSFPSLLRISSCSCDAPMLWWWEYESLIMSYKLVACTTDFFSSSNYCNDLSAFIIIIILWIDVLLTLKNGFIFCVSIAAYTTFIWFTQLIVDSYAKNHYPKNFYLIGSMLMVIYTFIMKIICLLISHDLFI